MLMWMSCVRMAAGSWPACVAHATGGGAAARGRGQCRAASLVRLYCRYSRTHRVHCTERDCQFSVRLLLWR